MIVHTLPETYVGSYAEICDWIDARFPESVPEGRYIAFVNTRLDHPDFEKRDLEDWVDSPLIRPIVLVDIPANYGFLPSFFQDALHVPFHVVFADDQADVAAEFAAEWLA